MPVMGCRLESHPAKGFMGVGLGLAASSHQGHGAAAGASAEVPSQRSQAQHRRVASSFEDGEIVEAVVIFTSSQIASGEEPSFLAEHNEYMQRVVRKTWPRGMQNAVEVVTQFLQKEFGGVEIYLVQIDVNDFSECFEAVAKAILRFHAPGTVGKHIWANLTGGTNVLNAALIQAAYLSGLVPKLYYTFVANPREDGKYLQPFSRAESEFDYREIYVVPTTFDERYRHLLEELEQLPSGEWMTKEELLSRLKGRSPLLFKDLQTSDFTRNYLNVWPGIQRKGSRSAGQENAVRLSSEGLKLLNLLKLPWFVALLERSVLTDEQREYITDGLNVQKL